MIGFRDLGCFALGIGFMLAVDVASAHTADRFPSDVNSTTLDGPFIPYPFYVRADMVTYCVDHAMIFTSGHDACARPGHACSIAYPVLHAYDWREIAAICNSNWTPHIKDWF